MSRLIVSVTLVASMFPAHTVSILVTQAGDDVLGMLDNNIMSSRTKVPSNCLMLIQRIFSFTVLGDDHIIDRK
jgi:hypothetical protein